MAVISLTETAASKVKDLLAREASRKALRLRVIDGGCSGMRYELSFDDELADADFASEQHGVRVIVDAESARFVEGTTIDFASDLNDSGFKIQNPRAQSTCGCGESFGV